MNVRELGSGPNTLVFVHGLGASLEYYEPLIKVAGIEKTHRIILYDVEGQGLSSTAASSIVTLETYVEDLENLLCVKGITKAKVVGWSLGGLIAMLFCVRNSSVVDKLVLLGPGPSPFPEVAVGIFTARAAAVRAKGMDASNVAQAVSLAATSPQTQQKSPVLVSSVRQALLATHPEGYAKGCMALVQSKHTEIRVEELKMPVLLVTGADDTISTVALVREYAERMPNAKLEVIDNVGHWHVTEDVESVASAVTRFL